MVYVCIYGGSYENLDFDDRECLRENLRRRLEARGVRFLEYCWVWDERDRCLLVVGTYGRMSDAEHWIETLERMGFEVVTLKELPGEALKEETRKSTKKLRRGWDLNLKIKASAGNH